MSAIDVLQRAHPHQVAKLTSVAGLFLLLLPSLCTPDVRPVSAHLHRVRYRYSLTRRPFRPLKEPRTRIGPNTSSPLLIACEFLDLTDRAAKY
ncbi:hypothetical protein F5146DRAFT_1012277 [Armillaria mellea]|nr:hypothetical protein F5146DRAFT_1012277 [Armillaria mellea]